MSEFEGIGLAVGVVRGARSFKVDSLGRLVGVRYEKVWRPGENVSECLKGDSAVGGFVPANRFIQSYRQMVTYQWTGPNFEIETDEPPSKPLQHSFKDCSCGFYAYYDGSNDFHEPGQVAGVVEGYGETLIGTRGFRAQKARIVALRISKRVPAGLASRVARNYPDVSLFASFKSMVAEFPPDVCGMDYTPDSDPEFWERKV